MNWNAVLRAIAPQGTNAILAGASDAMPGIVTRFAIDTALRQAHFLAQCAHESAGLAAVVERGSDAYFARYDGRKTLGNMQPGDGARFRGRGLIQLTGRRNYTHYGVLLGVDLAGHPERAAAFPLAAETAACFWRENGLNALADRDDISAVTRRINGGLNGLASRARFLAKAKAALATASASHRARPAAGQASNR